MSFILKTTGWKREIFFMLRFMRLVNRCCLMPLATEHSNNRKQLYIKKGISWNTQKNKKIKKINHQTFNFCLAYIPVCNRLSSSCCDWTWQADPRTGKAQSADTQTNGARRTPENSACSWRNPRFRPPPCTFPIAPDPGPSPIYLLH